MIIRVRGEMGVTRVEWPDGKPVCGADLYHLVATKVPEAKDNSATLKDNGSVYFSLSRDPAQREQISPADDGKGKPLNIKHGDMIFLHKSARRASGGEEAETEKVSHPSSLAPNGHNMDTVDLVLSRQSGRIERARGGPHCQHGPSGMCMHCQPLEPYDAGYAEERGIKHLSFHAYLRKLNNKSSGSSSSGTAVTVPFLEEPDYRVRPQCPRHAPYPAAICSLCQPSAITLNQQPFRMTDHVEFESPQLIENFLAGWRRTGYQVFGWLYGRYETYTVVPLGIKAVVSAIYEPPQDGSIDGFVLLDEQQSGEGGNRVDDGASITSSFPSLTPSASVREAAHLLGLQCIGMIYTDLRDDGSGKGRVERRRGPDTFFLSGSEVLFAADQQMHHPSPWPASPTRHYGSKFVTVVLSGDEEGAVGVSAYQVSLQAMAMVRADLISATSDPALLMIRASTPTHYVPDVIYSADGGISRLAQPTFPVDYLLVSLSHGFPRQTDPLFNPTAVYVPLWRVDGLNALRNYLNPVPGTPEGVARLLANFNLFIHLLICGLFSPAQLANLAQAIRSKSSEGFASFMESAGWKQLVEGEEAASSTSMGGVGTREVPIEVDDDSQVEDRQGPGSAWSCPHCTFLNTTTGEGDDNCAVCGLPRRWQQ